MYEIRFTAKMRRDAKRMAKRGKDISKLTTCLALLASGAKLPVTYRDHPLTGNYSGNRECHLESDWLLIYRIHQENLILVATETGTHADLFGL